MSEKKEKKPRFCLECGEPIPADRHPATVTCSERCYAARVDRQRKTKAKELMGQGRTGVKRRPGEPGQRGTRQCASGCGRWINDYRCPECWAKLRAKHGVLQSEGESGYEEHYVCI